MAIVREGVGQPGPAHDDEWVTPLMYQYDET
jgi:hypothetical protein